MTNISHESALIPDATDDQKIDGFLATFEVCRQSLEMNIQTFKSCKVASPEFVQKFELARDQVLFLIEFINKSRDDIKETMEAF